MNNLWTTCRTFGILIPSIPCSVLEIMSYQTIKHQKSRNPHPKWSTLQSNAMTWRSSQAFRAPQHGWTEEVSSFTVSKEINGVIFRFAFRSTEHSNTFGRPSMHVIMPFFAAKSWSELLARLKEPRLEYHAGLRFRGFGFAFQMRPRICILFFQGSAVVVAICTFSEICSANAPSFLQVIF